MLTLVLVPGLLCDHRLWAAQIAALSARVEILVADLTEGADLTAMATCLLARAPARFSLAGFSLGSQVALRVMELAGDRVERLALLSATRGGLTPHARSLIGNGIAQIGAGAFDAYLEAAFPTYVAPAHVRNATLRQTYLAMAHAVGPDAAVRQMEALLSIPGPFAHLDAITCPTLVLGGAADTRTPPAAHDLLAGAIRGSRYTVISGCGHLTPLESPGAVNFAFRSWLAKPAV